MTTLRKIFVYLLALAIAVFAFVGYNHFFGTAKIILQDERDTPDIDVPIFNKESSGIDGVYIGNVKPSRFVDLDENKNIKQIFGYDELLNPDEGTDQWKLKKPYMNIFEGTSRYNITSDRGTVRVEDVAGKPSPTDAHLKDHVVINILSAPQNAEPTETNIYLDDLIYNSERSEFSTDGPVKIVSDQGTMQGTGLLLVYNGNLGRIEYLEITRLHEIYLNDVSNLSSNAEPAKPEQPLQKTAVPAPGKDEQIAAKPKPATAAKPATEPEKTSPPVENYYTCTITENVIIKYGNRITIVGSDEIVINNVQFADSSTESPNETIPDTPAASEPVASVAIKASEPAPVVPAPVAPATEEAKPAHEEDVIDLTVTCNGSLIIIPVENEKAVPEKTDRSPEITRNVKTDLFYADPPDSPGYPLAIESANLTQTQSTPSAPAPVTVKNEQSTPPAQFSADRIDYDMITGDAIARRNIKFTFYTKDPNDADPIPMVITAEKNAGYFADQDRIVFNKNVVGTRMVEIPAYIQTNTFRGQKLIVDLLPAGAADEVTVTANPDTTDIRHITVIGGTVKLESIRKSGDVTLSNTILTCRRIDYDDPSAIITATGPGELFVNNENAPPVPEDPNGTDKGMSLRGPCYAYMQGFDKLNWFTAANRITAYGKKDSLFVSHITLKDGLPSKKVMVVTSHVVADLIETAAGRNELVSLNATGGITYDETEYQIDEEKSRPGKIEYIADKTNEFIGDNLFYDVPASLVTVNGSPRFPCFLNGVRVDKIEFDPQTEKFKADMSPNPSPMTPSSKKKSKRSNRRK